MKHLIKTSALAAALALPVIAIGATPADADTSSKVVKE